jgi:hypothetical protein
LGCGVVCDERAGSFNALLVDAKEMHGKQDRLTCAAVGAFGVLLPEKHQMHGMEEMEGVIQLQRG